MSCKTLYVVRDLLRVWVGFRAVNVTGRVGSVRAVSNDFGFGPGSGFSLKPVQTSKLELLNSDTGRELSHISSSMTLDACDRD